ncbi:MAG TPA: DUF2330 domain-containing protein [Candidatus Limnocylindria bacterium]|nr:DUF2330 domain-containing protein [Candidatus Limnocylindria bacterium]
MRRLVPLAAAMAVLLLTAGPTFACGGLIGPNGAVNLLRTTTFAGYHDGVEHYVTSFAFAGGEGEFGSLVPLPDVPTSVERGGDWTLQRLILETEPQPLFLAEDAALAGAARAEVLLEVRIDALDITILRGGGPEVGTWATEHGFRLPPDAPEVLDFYASRSPIFLAAVFDADAAATRGQAVGDGTPVHLTIPTDDPWVPLRILALGKQDAETVEADVYLLTDQRPALLPAPETAFAIDGMELAHSGRASDQLLTDLRSDKGMDWVPDQAWLTKVRINSAAPDVTFDLAIDAGGGLPSLVDAGLKPSGPAEMLWATSRAWGPLVLVIALPLLAAWFAATIVTRRAAPPPAGA